MRDRTRPGSGLRRGARRVRGRVARAEPVEMGVGGSIPFIATFQDSFPGAAVLVTGVADPDCRAHGRTRACSWRRFERACLGEALLLRNLASHDD